MPNWVEVRRVAHPYLEDLRNNPLKEGERPPNLMIAASWHQRA
jgi:hypothetical protein